MIYVVRHGQTDIPLNETGCLQARNVSKDIAKFNIGKIYSSDLLRARKTADIINEKIGAQIILDKRLREVNYGNLEGVLRDTITQETWNIYNTNPEKLNAESKLKVFTRIKNFLDDIKEDKENILIVAHGGTLRMIMYYANNNEFDNEKYETYMDIKINNADIFQFDRKTEFKK